MSGAPEPAALRERRLAVLDRIYRAPGPDRDLDLEVYCAATGEAWVWLEADPSLGLEKVAAIPEARRHGALADSCQLDWDEVGGGEGVVGENGEVRRREHDDGWGGAQAVWEYTGDLGATRRLVEHSTPPHWDWSLDRWGNADVGGYRALSHEVDAEEPCLALLAALLRALVGAELGERPVVPATPALEAYEAAARRIYARQRAALPDPESVNASRPFGRTDVPPMFWDGYRGDARAALEPVLRDLDSYRSVVARAQRAAEFHSRRAADVLDELTELRRRVTATAERIALLAGAGRTDSAELGRLARRLSVDAEVLDGL